MSQEYSKQFIRDRSLFLCTSSSLVSLWSETHFKTLNLLCSSSKLLHHKHFYNCNKCPTLKVKLQATWNLTQGLQISSIKVMFSLSAVSLNRVNVVLLSCCLVIFCRVQQRTPSYAGCLLGSCEKHYVNDLFLWN